MTVATSEHDGCVDHAAQGRDLSARARGPLEGANLGLTPREGDVVRLMAAGLTAYAIGRALAISERTVHKHLQNAYRKLGANDRLSAVRVLESVGRPN